MVQAETRISAYLESEIAGGGFPGAQYVVARGEDVVFTAALGHAILEPERIAATVDTIYDLASLTKPLVTSLLAVIMHERGLWDLGAPIGEYLIECKSRRRLSLTELLTHTSGLPNWRPLYLQTGDPSEVIGYIAALIDDVPAATEFPVVYSDLNYILLGRALERVTGCALDELAKRNIFEPLRLERTMFNPPLELRRQTAATELGRSFELTNAQAAMKGTEKSEPWDTGAGEQRGRGAGEHGSTEIPFTPSPLLPFSPAPLLPPSLASEEVIWGQVHDGNANYLGGVAGHAGLFSTAAEAFRIASQCLPGSRLVGDNNLRWFTENLTPGRETARSIGWVLAATRDCSAGPVLPPSAIGHNGFTGTSIWMDVERRDIFVLLTNRVHPHIGAVDIKAVRQRFNTLAVEALNGV